MADAGFDPRQSIDLWCNMDVAAGGGRPPDFLSTHPGPSACMRVLNENMPDAMERRERAHAAGSVPDCLMPDQSNRR
jgi:predicted Zn-dependent protease